MCRTEIVKYQQRDNGLHNGAWDSCTCWELMSSSTTDDFGGLTCRYLARSECCTGTQRNRSIPDHHCTLLHLMLWQALEVQKRKVSPVWLHTFCAQQAIRSAEQTGLQTGLYSEGGISVAQQRWRRRRDSTRAPSPRGLKIVLTRNLFWRNITIRNWNLSLVHGKPHTGIPWTFPENQVWTFPVTWDLQALSTNFRWFRQVSQHRLVRNSRHKISASLKATASF